MSETAQSEVPQQQFDIQRLYLKDVSFEAPQSPAMFQEEWAPQLDFQVKVTHQALAENVYEVVLHLTSTVKVKEKTAFLAEIQHAGIFSIAGFEDTALGHVLEAYCPNLIFPYAREVISDLSTKGGFPPLILAPINFDALFEQKLNQNNEPEA